MKMLAVAIATLASALPATLDADIQTDGPLIRWKQQELRIGDTLVTVQLDRGIMAAGGKVSATIVASSDRPHRQKLHVSALENMGYGEERVPTPDQVVGSRSIEVEAAPGGGPPHVETFKLAERGEAPGYAHWFTIDVSAQRSDQVASAGVASWSGNQVGLAIEPPATIPAEGPFTIAVRLTNTSKYSLDPSIELGSFIGGVRDLESRPYVSEGDDYAIEPIDESAESPKIPPGAEQLVIFRVTPKHRGVRHFTFVAQSYAFVLEASQPLRAMAVAAFDRPDAPSAGATSVSLK